MEDSGVDVLGHLHEEEPVPVVALADDHWDVIAVVGTSATGKNPPTGLAEGEQKTTTGLKRMHLKKKKKKKKCSAIANETNFTFKYIIFFFHTLSL